MDFPELMALLEYHTLFFPKSTKLGSMKANTHIQKKNGTKLLTKIKSLTIPFAKF